MGIELLGAVPLDPRIGKSADFGVSFLDEYPESPASEAYLSIIDRECLTSYVFIIFLTGNIGIKEILGDD